MFFLLKLLLSPKSMLGMAVGAAAVWFADPEKGAQRRSEAITAVKGRTGNVEPTTPVQPTLWTPGDTPATAEAV
jgi:hypothetical protein